ncbi:MULTISPECIES: electron transfer flavoprotein subunit beta/FixA family protein [Corynebacterium]|uniref:Electron transfer flavoprotein subunit beta n=1 Tax=Corynebacterium evansiae TaxID=2913499 RepID=A0A9X3RFA3_9CORY|nr:MULTISPECIES: electron transfer flavoprotein subunit beta/FixA family protein [Corynebacterium]MCG7258133.1 electron transfer flavoprotein subunit beta/FixA family protein [Corynebacterium sp. ACRQK]MCG7262566.1 electron transfer flavoprotein subunit beta/FixA family protein [Corynebacterium sp. ACRQL]MCG7268121.1 electron transfer flavoprotein subunit beta/FixA family protein [Corynebacterium sp. ACRQJ]MCG7457595.1 electron transfer flavoprotein subunit beta/FixA family protein [Corynebacte
MSNIVVLVKQVPDTYSERKLTDDDFTLDRDSADAVLDEINENAVEAALQLKEADSSRNVIVLSVGPERATEALRKALSLGCDEAKLVVDENLAGSDALGTAWTLSNALNQIEDIELIIAGNASTDGGAGSIPGLLAEYRQIPALTHMEELSVEGGKVTGKRVTEEGVFGLEAPTPAIVSVTEKSNTPRFAAFKGIMAAKKKTIEELSLEEIGVDAANVGLANATTSVSASTPKPPKSAGEIVNDEGEGGKQLVEFLVKEKLV